MYLPLLAFIAGNAFIDPTLVRSCLVISANKMCNLLKINKKLTWLTSLTWLDQDVIENVNFPFLTSTQSQIRGIIDGLELLT